MTPFVTDNTTREIVKLPPLILHPFSDANGPNKLVESSRASMMMQGLLPNNEFTVNELDRKLLEGRYIEIRMLYYVGKDLLRWLEQCMDVANRDSEMVQRKIREQSFAQMLVDNPPEEVQAKLRKWGVADYRAIFSRSLGLNSVFATVPDRHQLSDEFVRHYYRYADHMYACFLNLSEYTKVSPMEFTFDLYASGEYTRMLERQWEEQMGEDHLGSEPN